MKNICKVKAIHRIVGIIAFVEIIGFSMAACGGGGDDSSIIPGHTHTPGAAATCTTAQTCTVCGEVIVAALGHDWADTVNKRLCLTCGELNFTPARTIDLADDTGDIDFTETGTVLIKGVSNGQRRININDVTDVYIENGTVITGPDAVSSIQISVSSASTIYGGGSGITITGGSGTSEGIYGAVDILTIAGKMGSISGGIGGIRSNADLIITGSTGNISGGNFGLYATNSVTISGSIGNDTASSLTGGFMGQIYINGSSYNDFPLSTPKPWVWN